MANGTNGNLMRKWEGLSRPTRFFTRWAAIIGSISVIVTAGHQSGFIALAANNLNIATKDSLTAVEGIAKRADSLATKALIAVNILIEQQPERKVAAARRDLRAALGDRKITELQFERLRGDLYEGKVSSDSIQVILDNIYMGDD